MGNGYYCIEVFFRSSFNTAMQVIRLASLYYLITEKLHISYMNWWFKDQPAVSMDTIMTIHDVLDGNEEIFSKTYENVLWMATRDVNNVCRALMPTKIIDNYLKVNEIFHFNVASFIEDGIIRNFKYGHNEYNSKSKKVSLKAAALNPLKDVLVDQKFMQGNNSPVMLL